MHKSTELLLARSTIVYYHFTIIVFLFLRCLFNLQVYVYGHTFNGILLAPFGVLAPKCYHLLSLGPTQNRKNLKSLH